MGVGCQGKRHDRYNPPPPGERPGTPCLGGWVGPRAGLDNAETLAPPQGFDPRTVQQVESLYRLNYPGNKDIVWNKCNQHCTFIHSAQT